MFSFYSILDQSVTIAYQEDSYAKTESDLRSLIKIASRTKLTKGEIIAQFKGSDDFLIKDDTLFLNRIEIVFKDDKLFSLTDRW